MPDILLAEISAENLEACANIAIDDSQIEFVPSAQRCVADLKTYPASRGVAVISRNTIVGIAVYGPEVSTGHWKIFRLLIDKAYQGMGYGKAATRAILQEIDSRVPGAEVRLCYHPKNERARQLYGSLGFRETDYIPTDFNSVGKVVLAIRR